MFHVVIPARYASTRLPGKPLAAIGGRSLIQWVWERAAASGAASVIVATDDERIRDAVIGFGADFAMTSSAHTSGTDRIAEVVRLRGFTADDIIVNVQGDEPLIEPRLIAGVAEVLRRQPQVDIASAVAPIRSLGEFLDSNCVKALRAGDGRALYFSRAPVPWPRDSLQGGMPADFSAAWRHIGIYAYRVHSLLRFAAWPPTQLEQIERLEQLRALEHGMHIQLLTLDQAPPAGVDTPEDLERIRALLVPPP
jgi:3-deoxy-manno-octulosonate cytidylyltransferase (CMP-KDO synthetase)